MTRVRFAPSPTGTLHVGNALSAVANRRFGDYLLLRIDDTDPARNVPGGEEAIEADLGWLGDRLGRGPGSAERPGGAAPRGGAAPPVSSRSSRACRSGGPTARRRFISRASSTTSTFGIIGRDPRLGSPAERAAARRSASRARLGAADGSPTTASSSETTARSCRSGPRAPPSPPCVTPAIRPRRCAPTSRSSTCPGTTCGSTSTASARCRWTSSPG